MSISEIRHEGFYIEEDASENCIQHTEYTRNLLNKSINMVDEVTYWICDGVCFINGIPHAELIDFEGELYYKPISE